jgi:hypothetical protein
MSQNRPNSTLTSLSSWVWTLTVLVKVSASRRAYRPRLMPSQYGLIVMQFGTGVGEGGPFAVYCTTTRTALAIAHSRRSGQSAPLAAAPAPRRQIAGLHCCIVLGSSLCFAASHSWAAP